MYSVYLCVLRPAFASWMRKNPQKPRGRLLMFLKHVTTCNGMHADWLPSADPWWFQVWLGWKRNRKVSKSRANSRQFGCLSSASRARCQQYTCRVRAHQRGGHMVQINHLIFFFLGGAGAGMSPWLWLWTTAQLLRDVLALDELPQCCSVCESTAEDIITTVCILIWAPLLGQYLLSAMWIW